MYMTGLRRPDAIAVYEDEKKIASRANADATQPYRPMDVVLSTLHRNPNYRCPICQHRIDMTIGR